MAFVTLYSKTKGSLVNEESRCRYTGSAQQVCQELVVWWWEAGGGGEEGERGSVRQLGGSGDMVPRKSLTVFSIK